MGYPAGVPPYISNYRSLSDERHSSSTSNSLSPRMPPSESATEDSSEEETSADSSDEQEVVNVVQRKVPPGSKARVASGQSSRQRAKRG